MAIISGCNKEEPFTYKDPSQLEETEFTFIPSQPNSNVETAVVFYGCRYFATTSLVALKDKIEIIKEFNSEQEWPCNLKNDTIYLGKLTKGIYNVTLKIVDKNSSAANSIYFTENKTLVVTKN